MKLQQLYSQVRQAIEDYDMIHANDRIAIGISGGKDSITLLYALAGLRHFYPVPFEIVAVTLWLTKDNLFYLLNFSYIGSAIALGLLLFQLNYRHARRIGFIRYITFTASLVFVGALFLCHVENIEQIMFWAFLVGNILYYAIGIILAFAFRDNRAFCKYICPITVFLKSMSYFSLFRVKCDKERCVSCGKCKRVCPMNVDVTDNSRKRENGTECIMCMECVKACPKKAL